MKRIFITGAGGGIGLACATKFLENGWEVAAHYHISAAHLQKLQNIFGKQRLVLLKADFRYGTQLKKVLEFLRREKFTALVNNAGMYDYSITQKDRLKGIQETLMVNTIAPTLIAETVIEQMKRQEKGFIVNVSSIAADYGTNSRNIFYGISKGGLEVMTKTFAQEGAPYHICVNTLRPGVTNTVFHQKIGKDLRKRKKMIPMGKLVEPEEIADVVFFLCNENHSITNQILTIAGGE